MGDARGGPRAGLAAPGARWDAVAGVSMGMGAGALGTMPWAAIAPARTSPDFGHFGHPDGPALWGYARLSPSMEVDPEGLQNSGRRTSRGALIYDFVQSCFVAINLFFGTNIPTKRLEQMRPPAITRQIPPRGSDRRPPGAPPRDPDGPAGPGAAPNP
jgi:hypothetical protein